MQLRDYQFEAVSAIESALTSRRSTLAVLATGTGKTEIAIEVIRRRGGTAICVADRDELVYQPFERMNSRGIRATVDKGDVKADFGRVDCDRPIICTSVQTMSRPARQSRLIKELVANNCPPVTTLWFDEAHHAVATSWQNVRKRFFELSDSCKLLGTTATPDRADEMALGEVFDRADTDHGAAYLYDISNAVEDGYLVPVRAKSVVVKDLDFSRVHKMAGELNPDEVERILIEERHLHSVASPMVQLCGNNQTIVFCVTVNHAKLLMDVAMRYARDAGRQIEMAWLSGKTPMEERRKAVDKFRRGEINYLFNCGLFYEGFDAPNAVNCVMARPTASRARFAQAIGRTTRPLKGVIDGLDTAAERRAAIAASAKPFCFCMDFVGNSGRHRLATAADVLGGKTASEAAKELASRYGVTESDNGILDVNSRLKRAEAELALEAEHREFLRARAKRKSVVARVDADVNEVSLTGRRMPQRIERRDGANIPNDRPSDKQLGFLRYLARETGTTWIDAKWLAECSRRQCSAMIGKLKEEHQGVGV